MSQQPQAKYRKDYKVGNYTITNIDLDFDLHQSYTKITAISQVEQVVDNTDSLFLNGEGLTLKRLEIDGVAWTAYEKSEHGLTLLQLPKSFTLLIETEIDPAANTSLEGLYLSDGAYCTQCEAEGFRRITYYLDRPDVLAKFTTKITANKAAFPFLLSNGNKVDSGDLPADESGNVRHWVKWQDPFAKPCYLFALVAGDFDLLKDTFVTRSGRDVALEIYVDKGNLDRADHAMVSLKNSMKWDETRFDLEYDLDIYMIVAVDFFNMGAMENKGLNVFNSKYVLANKQTATDSDYLGIEAVIGHEYFHNWTGNRVTCRDWFQLSLKEGLTVFRDQEFSSDLGSRAVNRINNVRIMRGPQFAEDSSPMAHPIRPEKVIEMNNFYTLTVYEKGSEVIRMMHTLLGEMNFQKGMKLYFERHDGTAATCEDFVKAMEEASGIDLRQFRLWYSQSGTPVLDVTSQYDENQQTLSLTIEQHTPQTADQSEKQALLIPFDVEFYAQDGSIIPLKMNGEAVGNVLSVTQDAQTFVFENVTSKPVISMLREFSAPVKLNYDYSDDELSFLMVNARNDFARWDASQMLLAKYIKANIDAVQANKKGQLPDSLIEAFRGILADRQMDRALVAEILRLPSETEIAGWYRIFDVDVIYQVRRMFITTFATQFANELKAIYRDLYQSDYTIEHSAIADRALRNVCLSYLANIADGEALVREHYSSSTNMTDTVAALSAANDAQLPCRAELMQHFSEQWKHDGLVMDKWFMLQGANPAAEALDNVKAQLLHPAFSMKNPNRIYSLIGSFVKANPVHFHEKEGSGYQFLADILIQLNESNPQVASRLIDPLLKVQQVDLARQELMRKQLTKLAGLENLANDLYEKINKALSA